MSSVFAYFSHSIRGRKGENATEADMRKNCEAAIEVAAWIRESVPELELYVPAEHEDFVCIAYLDKYLTDEQILEIDCKILEKRDFVIVWVADEFFGGGVGVEIQHAKKIGKSVYHISYNSKSNLEGLKIMVKRIQEMKND